MLTPISEIASNTPKFVGKKVVVKGVLRIDTDHIYIWETLSGESEFLFIDVGKIGWNDKGFDRKRVVLIGFIKDIDCEPEEATIITCGTYLSKYSILSVK